MVPFQLVEKIQNPRVSSNGFSGLIFVSTNKNLIKTPSFLFFLQRNLDLQLHLLIRYEQ